MPDMHVTKALSIEYIFSFEICMPFRVSFLNVIFINVSFKHSKNYS